MAKYDNLIDQLETKKDVLDVFYGLHDLPSNELYEHTSHDKEFIKNVILRDWCRREPYTYKEGIINFINSKELSDIMKEEILKTSPSIKFSDKDFNDMTPDEIKKIRNDIRLFYCFHDEEDDENLSAILDQYLMKLDGSGPKEYIINNFSKRGFSSMILLSSGLCSEGSYYYRQPVDRNNLNEKHLILIHDKLSHFDKKYADEFRTLVKNIKTLSAEIFIESFNNFVINNCRYDDSVVSQEEKHEDYQYVPVYTSTEIAKETYNRVMTNDMKEEFEKELFYRERKEKEEQKICQIKKN